MTDFKPGEIVDIEIKDAKFSMVDGDRFEVEFGQGGRRYFSGFFSDLTGVTITRQAPKPQAGDTWEMSSGERFQIHGHVSNMWATDVNDGQKNHRIGVLDLTDAKLLFRLPEQPKSMLRQVDAYFGPEKPEPKARRRFKDRYGDEWTQTRYGIDRYTYDGDSHDLPWEYTRRHVENNCGPLTDLDPIPAPDDKDSR